MGINKHSPIKQIPHINIYEPVFYNYLLLRWWKLLKVARVKYRLSVNCVMVLNACYMYNKYVKDVISINGLCVYFGYFDKRTMGRYITVLRTHGFLSATAEKNNRGFNNYRITLLGIECIDSIQGSYLSMLSSLSLKEIL